jgi:hypothetical protein
METEKERLKILDMIDSGQISVEEGIRLLSALPDEEQQEPSPLERIEMPELAPHLSAQEIETPDEAEAPGDAFYNAQAEPVFEAAAAPPEEPSDEAPETANAQASAPEERSAPFDTNPEVLTPNERFDPSKSRFRQFWLIPLWAGAGIMLIGALLMYWAWSASGFGFWFACTWLPFMLGVLVMALAWSSRTARWLHVRVHQKPGEKPERIAISLPIPLRLTAWLLRIFGNRIPKMEGTSLDEVIMALDATSPEAPFYVEVNEGENGERVEVYIG